MPEGSPMMLQYHKIKEQYPDCLLFYRLGDFYEMFQDDAKIAARELELTLTTRDRGKDCPEEDRVPMCGVPFHACDTYLARLISKGYKVAICEQLEDPAKAKGLVERNVIRIVTPGTVTDSSMLEARRPNYICSVYADGSGVALCFAELSTGEICATAVTAGDTERVSNELIRFSPAETVLNPGAMEDPALAAVLRERLSHPPETRPDAFDYTRSAGLVCAQFSVESLDELHLGGEPGVVCAVGGLLDYLNQTQKTPLTHINKLEVFGQGRYMELDSQTIRNLELFQSAQNGDRKGTLLWVLDKTRTPMGGRMLRAWISRPLLSPAAILRRQTAVAELVRETVTRQELLLSLKGVGDLERIMGRVVCGSAGSRDLAALAASCQPLPELVRLLEGRSSARLRELAGLNPLSDLRELLLRAIVDDPPFSLREGGFIRTGYDSQVDHLRSLLEDSSQTLAAVEARERERTGKKLRVSYNKIFGYYLEIPRSMSQDVPEDYIRKQTLVNCERFTTSELKALEVELTTARERLEAREYELFTALRETLSAEVARVQATAACAAELDVLCALAEAAAKNQYCQPTLDISGELEIRDGRHPVVELTQDARFVPNDVSLNNTDCRAAIITGPNMAGKSTYMRQTALIVLMAQLGSFVPASSARVGIVDRIFTRIGASDDLAGGRSTFMVEMTQMAEILREATCRSLLILDEIGRGTSTYDGMAIARAVLEHCAEPRRLGAKTLFATHYHELTALEGAMPGIRNFHITAKKRDGEVIFLRKIVPGGASDSYGIEVAELAGLPDTVIRRAREVLKSAETQTPLKSPTRRRVEEPTQVSLTELTAQEVAETLRNTDLNTITPLEAMNLLFELRKKVSHET